MIGNVYNVCNIMCISNMILRSTSGAVIILLWLFIWMIMGRKPLLPLLQLLQELPPPPPPPPPPLQ